MNIYVNLKKWSKIIKNINKHILAQKCLQATIVDIFI